ncbi:MAG: hypothetical protein ABIG20_02940 [archaeon]
MKIIAVLMLVLVVLSSGCILVTEQDLAAERAEKCTDTETGEYLTISEAWIIALDSECYAQGELAEDYTCNENTGTWWIELEPAEPLSGCSPACVVDVNSKTAEINWRCTGLID